MFTLSDCWLCPYPITHPNSTNISTHHDSCSVLNIKYDIIFTPFIPSTFALICVVLWIRVCFKPLNMVISSRCDESLVFTFPRLLLWSLAALRDYYTSHIWQVCSIKFPKSIFMLTVIAHYLWPVSPVSNKLSRGKWTFLWHVATVSIGKSVCGGLGRGLLCVSVSETCTYLIIWYCKEEETSADVKTLTVIFVELYPHWFFYSCCRWCESSVCVCVSSSDSY